MRNQSEVVFIAEVKELTYISFMSDVSAILADEDGECKER